MTHIRRMTWRTCKLAVGGHARRPVAKPLDARLSITPQIRVARPKIAPQVNHVAGSSQLSIHLGRMICARLGISASRGY